MNEQGAGVSTRQFNWSMVGVILAIAVQTCAVIWWASQMDRRVQTLESAVKPFSTVAETMARLDERTLGMTEANQRIERRLDKLEERR